MTPGEDRNSDYEGDDQLAAEYVIGVLSADERQAAARRVETDRDFARLVDVWQERLSPLNAGYEEVQPPASVKQALDARLLDHGRLATQKPDLLQSLSFWRGLATAALVAFLLAVAIPLFLPTNVTPGMRLVASLTGEKTDVRYLAVYDTRISEVRLSHVTGDRAAGHDFELWVIKGNDPPVSLGVIPTGTNVHLVVTPAHRELIKAGALFAISIEPRGGSSTGRPTGPVVASGDLRSI
jgi:anti-sigma-K factor RskA